MNHSTQNCIKSQALRAHEKGCMESGQAMSEIDAVGWFNSFQKTLIIPQGAILLGCAGACYHKKGDGSLSALGTAVLIKSRIDGSAVISAYYITVEPPFRPSRSGTIPFSKSLMLSGLLLVYTTLAEFLFLMLVYIFFVLTFA